MTPFPVTTSAHNTITADDKTMAELSKKLAAATKLGLEVEDRVDSGYNFGESSEWSNSEASITSSSDENKKYFELPEGLEEVNTYFNKREESLKLDRKRNLLTTQLQHLKKNANILVIGADHAGKTSLINSLAYMIRREKEPKRTWRAAASYDLGKKYKFKPIQMYPETRTSKVPRVTFYEAGGFSKIKEVEKAATILQYAMEGRLEGRISSLLTLFLLLNTQDITERYREDPQDTRILLDRKVDCILYVASADEKPDYALFDIIATACNKSKDPAVKKMPILTCVTSPHDDVTEPVCPLADYDLGAYVKRSQEALRRNKSNTKLLASMAHSMVSGGASYSNNANNESSSSALEPASVRHIVYYRPSYDPFTDETDSTNIVPQQQLDQPLLTLFEETLRLAGRELHRPLAKTIYKYGVQKCSTMFKQRA